MKQSSYDDTEKRENVDIGPGDTRHTSAPQLNVRGRTTDCRAGQGVAHTRERDSHRGLIV